jgi:hypothetical protein
MCPTVVVWGRVESTLTSSFSPFLLQKRLYFLANRALASVSVATTPRSVDVAVDRLSKAPMVASSI